MKRSNTHAIELLSPVGDFSCLKAAVQNGADSVYFGASQFNARASATNFDLSQLKEATQYAKLRGVKTHLTLNILMKEEELEDAILLATKAYEFGIDAIIVQDLGLAKFLISHFPDLPIHASTQMTIHNLEGALAAEKLGFKRVVLARELSLEEITYICHNTHLEIETFIHGALCISYSGQCLFSSLVGGRSGNRGKCAQPCRLSYELLKENNHKKINLDKGYLLSTRDLCALEYIPSLIDAGVMCFKIEGRMKSPEYVATVTRIYRKYIDLALSNEPYIIDEADKRELALVFNRGGFSTGHYSNSPNKDLVFKEKQNHMGLYIGNVASLKNTKSHVFVNLKDHIYLGDSIQFENESSTYTISELMVKGQNKEKATHGLVELGRMKGNINVGDKVFRVNSKALQAFATESYQKENIKIPLIASMTIQKGKPLLLEVKTHTTLPIYQNIKVQVTSCVIPTEATSKPIEKERILAQLQKTNHTHYVFEKIDVALEENTFLPSIGAINELRRNALDKITTEAIQNMSRKIPTFTEEKQVVEKTSPCLSSPNSKPQIALLLNNLLPSEDYMQLDEVNVLYIPLRFFSHKKREAQLLELTKKYKVFIYMPTIIKANYKNILNNLVETSIDKFHISGFVLSNLSSAILMKELEKKYPNRFTYVANYTLNTYNSYTLQELADFGFHRVTLSPELDKNSLLSLCQIPNFSKEMVIYGRLPIMSMNYCLLGKTNHCYPTCGTQCQEKDSFFYLKDRLGFLFPVIPDNIQTVTTIFNSKVFSGNPSDFSSCDYLRICILNESVTEINDVIRHIKEGKRLQGKDFTNGNLNRMI